MEFVILGCLHLKDLVRTSVACIHMWRDAGVLTYRQRLTGVETWQFLRNEPAGSEAVLWAARP